ncbi:hypothetical protein V501_09322 [Pseudogymnoascus sp. VKM F-4519 (FW-2642)]|nr:hypothetical protein V501_09322 [Pseudogymnoascus sp. VKM F-4519 (FW-2642)]
MNGSHQSINWLVGRYGSVCRSFHLPSSRSLLPVPATPLAPSRPSFLAPSPTSSISLLPQGKQARRSHKPHPHAHRQQRNNPSPHPQPHLLPRTGALGWPRGGSVGGAGGVGGVDDGDVRDGLDVAVGVGGGADVGAGDGGVGEGVGWEGGAGGGGGDCCEV